MVTIFAAGFGDSVICLRACSLTDVELSSATVTVTSAVTVVLSIPVTVKVKVVVAVITVLSDPECGTLPIDGDISACTPLQLKLRCAAPPVEGRVTGDAVNELITGGGTM